MGAIPIRCAHSHRRRKRRSCSRLGQDDREARRVRRCRAWFPDDTLSPGPTGVQSRQAEANAHPREASGLRGGSASGAASAWRCSPAVPLPTRLSLPEIRHRDRACPPLTVRPHSGPSLICFLALVLHRVMRMRLKARGHSASPRAALDLLARIQKHTAHIGDRTFNGTSKITPEQLDLFESLNLSKPA